MIRERIHERSIGLITLFLAAAIAGCGSGNTADTTKPTVSSTVPAAAATGVAMNGNLAVTFSKPIDPSTITGATFTLKLGTTPVPGTVSYTGVTATFRPTQVLTAGTSYTATITSAKDLAGHALASSYSWSFTTGATADTTAPVASATVPADLATSVATNSAITATFSEALDPASITPAFTMTDSTGAVVAGTVTYVGLIATFHPTSALATGTRFTATITNGAKDLAGNALAADCAWSFTTADAPDTSPPTVASTSPLGAATGVLINSAVTATFGEAMDPATISTATFKMTGPRGAAVLGTVTYTGSTATFQPASVLATGTLFTATITAGAKDLAGNPLAAPHAWRFTTARETTPPTVASTSPVATATGVLTNSAITASFSEAMAPATLTAATFTVTYPDPESAVVTAVPGTVTYVGLIATFQPRNELATSTVFTATITTGAKDLAGNALAADCAWSFTTADAPDTTPPTVALTVPAKDALSVPTHGVITATFSEAMDPATITTTTFTVTHPDPAAVAGVAVTGTVTYLGLTATFHPASVLAPATLFTATITTGAKDRSLAGNALAADYVWSFTTGDAHIGLSPVLLGSAGTFAILSKSGITDVPASVVTGDVGTSPISGAALLLTCKEVTGTIRVVDAAGPLPCAVDDAPFLTTAIGDMELAYTDAAGRPTPDFLELGTGAIGGLNLTPGLYKWAGTVTIPTDVTLSGNATDVWIFQIAGDLTMSSAANVFLNGGALAKNVFWQVAGEVTVGTTAHFEGVILSQTAIKLQTGASMNGRALAQTAVVLDTATVTEPAP